MSAPTMVHTLPSLRGEGVVHVAFTFDDPRIKAQVVEVTKRLAQEKGWR